jgi:DNA-binding beta-propeller fold protein YncE
MPDNKKAYVTRENDGALAIVDTVKHVKTGDIQIGKATAPENIKPMKVILTPDGSTAYVSTDEESRFLSSIPATDKVTGSFEVGQRPWGIALSPDGKFLYSANGPSNDVLRRGPGHENRHQTNQGRRISMGSPGRSTLNC